MRTISCPRCRALLQVPEGFGGPALACGSCGIVVRLGAPTSAPPRAVVLGPATPAVYPSVAVPPVVVPRTSAGPSPAPSPGTRSAPRPPGSSPPRDRTRPVRSRRRRVPRWAPAALLAGAAVVLLLVVLVLRLGDREEGIAGGMPAQAPAPPAAPARPDRLSVLREAYAKAAPKTREDWEMLLAELRSLGPATRDFQRQVAEDYVARVDPHDAKLRAFLHHQEFDHPVPEAIAFRQYPYIQAVEAANEKRWFAPDEEAALRLAEQGWKETLEHRRRLATDRVFRAVDRIRANVATLPHLKDYNFATRWADPYLICYSSRERLSEYDLLSIADLDQRARLQADLARRRARFEPVLDEKAAIFQGLHREFLRRYGEPLGLHPLMDEYGGRPDLPPRERTYPDGVPLVVWIFEERESFREHYRAVHEKDVGEAVAGYFNLSDGWVYLYDGDEDRAFEIHKNAHEGVHQLQHWFMRQRSGWVIPWPSQDFLGEGWAEWLGSVRLEADRTLTFPGVSALTLQGIQTAVRLFRQADVDYPIFPLADLTRFGTYADVAAYADANMRIPPELGIALFYQQAWALVHFLNEGEEGRRRSQFTDFLRKRMSLHGSPLDLQEAFEAAFRLRSAADWDVLERAYRRHFHEEILRMDPDDHAYVPPRRR